MHKSLFIFLLFFETTGYSQNKGDLTFRVEVGRQNWRMSELNDIITDVSLIQHGQLNSPRDTKFERGLKITGSFGYQFSRLWEVGLKSNHQQGNCAHSDGFILPDGLGSYDTLDVDITYLSNTQSIGLFTRMSINNLVSWDAKSNLLNRLMLGVQFSCSYGFSSFETNRLILEDQMIISEDVFYKANANFILAGVEIDAGWLISKSNFVSSIGVNVGYQYFKTPDLANATGNNFMGSNRSVGVNLSGIYFGGYLKLGK